MVTQEFERFLYEIFANPRDGFATNQELSNMEMTARSFEKHVFYFASMKSQHIVWKPFRGLFELHIYLVHIHCMYTLYIAHILVYCPIDTLPWELTHSAMIVGTNMMAMKAID